MTEKQRAYQRAYRDRPESKAKTKAYNAAYQARPDVRAREAARRNNVEAKARAKAASAVHHALPRVRAERQAYYATPEGRFKWYKSGAAQRHLIFALTLEQFSFFWRKPCTYCGKAVETIGLDRVDNSLGYVKDNVVSCCALCNFMKRHLPVGVFVEHCRAIARVADLEEVLREL